MHSYLKEWIKKYFVFAGIFSFFVNMFNLTFPIYMLAIYDRVLYSFSIPTLLTLSAGAVMAIAVMGALDMIRSRILVLAGIEIGEALSKKILVRIIAAQAGIMPSPYKEGLRDLQLLRNYLGGHSIFFIFDLPWTIIYLLILYLIHPYLAYLAVGGAAVSLLFAFMQAKFTSHRLEISRSIEDNMTSYQNLLMLNADSIVAMNLFPGIINKWTEKYGTLHKLQNQIKRSMAAFGAVSGSFKTLVPVLVYGLGAWLVIKTEVTVGTIIAASIITRQMLSPVDSMVVTWNQTVEALGAYRRLDNLLECMKDSDINTSLPAPEGIVSAENISLQFSNRYLLHNISFIVKPGEIVTVVGPSGAGKSTFCKILLGIYEPTAGRVRLDGADIRQWNREEFGQYVGYLPQDVQLFSGTVAENIARLGDVDSEEVIETAKLAGVHEMILSLPAGYETQIGERGMALSGGQRQRIGLARAFYKNPKFVVLDEPNSNLDDFGEKALVAALRNFKQKGVSIVVVSHRPSILSVSDKVMVLRDGMIVAFGSSREVMARMVAQNRQGNIQDTRAQGLSQVH